jgi:acetyl-CoA C-acetyltransferase
MGKWTRGVSIIGAAYTPFGNVLETPEIKGMTFRELLSWAALEALQMAGITPKEVDSLLVAHYQTEPVKTQSIHAVAAEWLGLKKKPSVKYETACASGASGLRLGGSLIASGIDDIVLLTGVEILNSVMDEKPLEKRIQPGKRVPIDPNDQFDFVANGFDQAYFQPFGFDVVGGLSAFPILAYAKKYRLTIDSMDEAQSAASISLRRNAARNPRAWQRQEFSEIAKEAGFKSAMEYMKSVYNPFICWPVRALHVFNIADGAAALVLCPSEDAKKYTKTPVDVLGVGHAAGLPYYPDPLSLPAEKAAFEQAYRMANIAVKKIEYLGLHDCMVHQHFTVSEMAGYFAPGEAWHAILDGRTAFDGDKPINTHGGSPSMGNAHGTSGITEIVEAVLQMRGEAGDRQMVRPPNIAVCHALGAGPTFGVTVLGRRK